MLFEGGAGGRCVIFADRGSVARMWGCEPRQRGDVEAVSRLILSVCRLDPSSTCRGLWISILSSRRRTVVPSAPGGAFATDFDAAFGLGAADEVEREAADDGHILGAVTGAVAG